LDLLYGLPVLFFSIVVHEIAHGWVALKLGDTTARDAGRITFNPFPHIDILGSVMIPLISYIAAGTIFIAWAKPVPINPNNFKKFRRDDILVSAAGPVSNLIMAILCTVFFVASVYFVKMVLQPSKEIMADFVFFIIKMFAAGITLNIFLAVFNLIPIPPLDGSHILSSLLPGKIGDAYRRTGFLGILIIIALFRIEPVRNFLFFVISIINTPLNLLIGYLI